MGKGRDGDAPADAGLRRRVVDGDDGASDAVSGAMDLRTQVEFGSFPPLRESAKALNDEVRWYRCPMQKGKLGKLMERSDAQGLFQAVGHLAMWFCTGSLVLRCADSGNYLAVAPAMFLHGTVGCAFVYGCHELGHGTTFRTKFLNKFFLWCARQPPPAVLQPLSSMATRRIFSVLWWWEPYSYAASHTYHHRYTQFVHADRENVFPLEPSLDPWVLLEMFTVSLTGKPGRVFGKGGLISAVQLTIKGACGGIPGVPGTHRSAPLTAEPNPRAFAQPVSPCRRAPATSEGCRCWCAATSGCRRCSPTSRRRRASRCGSAASSSPSTPPSSPLP